MSCSLRRWAHVGDLVQGPHGIIFRYTPQTLSNLHVLHTSSSLLTLALLERILHSLLCLLAGGVAADANEGALGERPALNCLGESSEARVTNLVHVKTKRLCMAHQTNVLGQTQ